MSGQMMIGKKVGMSRVFDGQISIPVTVLEVKPNRVVCLKTEEKDGYSALQVTTGKKPRIRVTGAQAGQFAKAEVEIGEGLWEVPMVSVENPETLIPGYALTVDLFGEGQLVDVVGTTKGKGFQGGVKRHHFRTQDATHGNSLSHRALGSTGQCQDPGRVFKGKKMPGHLGDVRRTTQNLVVFRVDKERNLLLVKGAVPGAAGGFVFIRSAVKNKNKGE